MDILDDRQTSYRSRTDNDRSLASMGITSPFQPVLGPEVDVKPENVSSMSGSMSTRTWSMSRGVKSCQCLCERRNFVLRRPW